MTDSKKMILIILFTIFTIPSAVMVSAQQTVNEEDNTNVDISGDIIPTGPVGPVGIVNELEKAHSSLSIIMEDHSAGSYEHDYPFTMTYVDPDLEKLVVAMHPLAAFVGIEYDKAEIQQVLETTSPLKIVYAEFIQESTASNQTYYERYCTPDVTPGYIRVCQVYADLLIRDGIDVATLGPYTIFMDTFSNMQNWDLDGDDIEDDDLGRDYGVIPGHTTRNDVATNDDECDTCVMELDDDIDLSDYDRTSLSFWILLDEDFETGEYVKVEIKNGNTWTEQLRWTSGDSQWHKHTLTLPASNFNIRITAQINDDDHKFGIDNVIVKVENDAEEETPADTTAPVIAVPDNISGTPRVVSLGYYAEFTVTATDDVDSTVNVTCSHSSGYFQLGVTTVTCSATDAAGNTTNAIFTITVTSNTPTDSDGDGYHDGIDQCPNEASATNYGCLEDESTDTPITNQTIPIYAGIEHLYNYEYYLNANKIYLPIPWHGTIGFTGYTVNGTAGFVAAGHTFIPVDEVGHPTTPLSHKHEIKPTGFTREIISTVAPIGDYLNYEAEHDVDAVFVPITNETFVPSNQLKMRNNTIVDLQHGSVSNLERGDTIYIYGQLHNDDGIILFKNATIRTIDYHNNWHTMPNQLISHYDSAAGDSGAPIVTFTNDTASIVGMHTGTICQFSSVSEGQSELNFWLRNGSQYCGNATAPAIANYYKGFSPWDAIKEGLGLR